MPLNSRLTKAPRTLILSTWALWCALSQLSLARADLGTLLYETGFEPPRFAPGPIQGQDGWTGEGTTDRIAIHPGIARTGFQALCLDAYRSVDFTRTFKPLAGAPAGGLLVRIGVDMLVLDDGVVPSGNYRLTGFGDQGYIGTLVVDAGGGIQVLGGGGWLSTGARAAKNAWNRYEIEFDFPQQTFNCYIDGGLVLTNTPFANRADGLQRVGFEVNDPGEDTACFDNFTALASPLPGAVAAAAPSPDFNASGWIDFADFFLFVDQFGQPVGPLNRSFDLDGDRAINFNDFILLAERFGQRTPRRTGDERVVTLPGGEAMDFVWIGPGTFIMGTPDSLRYADDEDPEQVTISRGFYLGKFELTQRQWLSAMDTRPWLGQERARQDPDVPATFISWHDVQQLVDLLNELADRGRFRLPTEAEWEYACRAGTTTQWSCGDDESCLHDHAWFEENACMEDGCYPHQVGTKWPNPWGLYDMHGNVHEWAQDWYSDGYSTEALIDPQGPATGTLRVARGGDIWVDPSQVRSANPGALPPEARQDALGARLVWTE